MRQGRPQVGAEPRDAGAAGHEEPQLALVGHGEGAGDPLPGRRGIRESGLLDLEQVDPEAGDLDLAVDDPRAAAELLDDLMVEPVTFTL